MLKVYGSIFGVLLNNRDVKCYELSLKELDLATRLIKYIQQHEYDELLTITQCEENDLPNLLVLLEAGKSKLECGCEMIKMKFDFHQDYTLNRAIWYAHNFDDFFEDEFEAEFDDICNFYDKLNDR